MTTVSAVRRRDLPAELLFALRFGVWVVAIMLSACASIDERGRAPVDLDPCSIERAACRERCRRTAVHTFSCRVQGGVVTHLECSCEPGGPVGDDRP